MLKQPVDKQEIFGYVKLLFKGISTFEVYSMTNQSLPMSMQWYYLIRTWWDKVVYMFLKYVRENFELKPVVDIDRNGCI